MSLANVTGGLSASAAVASLGSISRAPSAPIRTASLMVGSFITGRSLNKSSLTVSRTCVKGGVALPSGRSAPRPFSALARLGPHHALILLRDRRQPLIQELLNALPTIRFGGEDIALRIRSDAVH